MAKISVVINAQNQERDLSRSISSVKNFADEVVVIDQESTDKTAEVAKKLGAKVFEHKRVPFVELARNYSISKTSGDWVLVLDPDEEVSDKLAATLKDIVKKPQADYFRIPRKNIIFDKWMKNSRWWPDFNIRFFKKGKVSWNEVIHSVPMTEGKGLDLPAEEDNSIIHHHYQTVEEFIDRMNRYTTQQAELKIKEGYDFSWKDLLTKPVDEFLSRYFYGKGYKDGMHGLSLALLQGFSELVLYLKVWQNKKFVNYPINLNDISGVVENKEKDIHYWISDSKYNETGKLIDRIKRRLKV